jgi:hypothetical protein
MAHGFRQLPIGDVRRSYVPTVTDLSVCWLDNLSSSSIVSPAGGKAGGRLLAFTTDGGRVDA